MPWESRLARIRLVSVRFLCRVATQLPGAADREQLDDGAVTTFCVDALSHRMVRSRQNEA